MSDSPESNTMPAAIPTPKPAPGPEATDDKAPATAQHTPKWKKYLASVLVVVLAIAVVATVTRNWNSWWGGKVEQFADDAYVRGNLKPLGTKVAGIVRVSRAEARADTHA